MRSNESMPDEMIERLTGQDLDIMVQNYVFHQEIQFRKTEDGKSVIPVSVGSSLDEYLIPEYHNSAFPLLWNLLATRHGKPFLMVITLLPTGNVECIIQYRKDWHVSTIAENPSLALARTALKAEAKLRETSGAYTLSTPTRHTF